jgi:nucleotide-binding universal stress UspA family protein
MFKKVLVPLDGSTRAETILEHVEDLAQRYDQSQVLLLQVVELVPTTIAVADAAGPLDQETINLLRKEARDYLETIQARLQKKGIEAHVYVLLGPVVATIVDLAVQEKVDLIAIASHGRTGLPAFFFGSIAAGVLHRTQLPLLIVRSLQPQKGTGEK